MAVVSLAIIGAVIVVGLVLVAVRRLTRKTRPATRLEKQLSLALLTDAMGYAEQQDSTERRAGA